MPITIVAALASAAVLQGAPGAPGAVKAPPLAQGYLSPGEFDVSKVVEPAPRPGDPRYDTDRAIFRATRALQGTPRWALATSDADYSAPALMRDFSCAAGAELTPQSAPLTLALVRKAGIDTARQTSHAKDLFQRARPFLIDKGPICEPAADLYDYKRRHWSYDYPSGHSTWGWTWALVLTALAPDRAQPILDRGRAYADSRFVCGVHNESAVEAGMLSASATLALVSTKPAYQADLAAARRELAGLRRSAPPPAAGCAVQAGLVAERVMPRLATSQEASTSPAAASGAP
ncbi:MAG: phosphatase PAP2 family protein [Caulobacteraceae bacterium]|nr:phosphatase PAP2 family protein [Caulobacter sp.]